MLFERTEISFVKFIVFVCETNYFKYGTMIFLKKNLVLFLNICDQLK